MSRPFLLAALLGTALLAAGTAAAQDWQVVWADEFDTPGAPDPAKWGYDIGGNGWGNQERQFYTDRRENARVENGSLVIEAREEAYNGSAYTSARLVTRGRAAWTYGRIEARMKLPFGQGIWPAFWMLASDSPYGGWPFSGEIDIMEYPNLTPDEVFGTIHYGGGTYGPCRANRGGVEGHCYSGTSTRLPAGSVSGDFHTYAIDWSPRQIQWSVDDRVYQTQSYWYSGAGAYPAPFDSPFHVLLNLAVGGQWPGYPDATTTFPQRLEVDYVRVYQDANAYPVVSLDAPAGGTTVEAGATVALAATATDGGTVQKVEFLQGGGVLGTDASAPYTLDVAGVADGCYTLAARATDDAGYTSETAPVPVTVGAGCPAGSRAPYLLAPAVLPGTVEAEYYDLGGADVAYRDFSAPNEGGGIRQDESVDLRPSRDDGAGYDVTNISAREWLTYTVSVSQAGTYRVLGRVAAAIGGTVQLSIDGTDLLGDVSIAATGGAVTYGNALFGTVQLPAGQHVLRLDMRSGGFSLNKLSFTLVGSTATEDADRPELGLRVAPNPVSGRATVTYSVPDDADAEIVLLDAVGRRVQVVVSSFVRSGTHVAEVDVAALATGVYTCVLKTGTATRSVQVTVAR